MTTSSAPTTDSLQDLLSIILDAPLTASDLAAEQTDYDGPTETAFAFVPANPEPVQVLYFDDFHRAGIAWGADAVWTDADSLNDALERYFGVGGKQLDE